MSDPRRAAAVSAGSRAPRRVRAVGWVLSVLFWALASDARPLLALFSVLAAVAIRTVYVAITPWGTGRSLFYSAWFFAVAGLCELAWLIGRSAHV